MSKQKPVDNTSELFFVAFKQVIKDPKKMSELTDAIAKGYDFENLLSGYLSEAIKTIKTEPDGLTLSPTVFSDELKKMAAVIKDPALYDPNSPPIFARLLADTKIANFLGRKEMAQFLMSKIADELIDIPELRNAIKPEVFKEFAPVAVKLMSKVLKEAKGSKLDEVFKNLQDYLTSDPSMGSNTEERDRLQNKQDLALSKLVGKFLKVYNDKDVRKVLTGDLVSAISNNEELLRKVAGKFIEISPIKEQIANFNISPKLIDNTVPLLANAASLILNNSPELGRLLKKQFEEYQNQSLSAEQQLDRQKRFIYALIDTANEVLKKDEINDFLKGDLKNYIIDNKKLLAKVVNGYIERDKTLEQALEDGGVTPKMRADMINAGMDLVADLVPVISDLTTACVKDQKQLTAIINSIYTAATCENASDRAINIASAAIGLFGFKDSNKGLQEVINKKIPELLDKHSTTIGPIIESFMKQTKMGRNLSIKGKDIVVALGNKLPQINEITTLFQNEEYMKIPTKALKLLFSDTATLKIAVTLLVDAVAYGHQKNMVTNDTRQAKSGEDMSKILGEILEKGHAGDKKELSTLLYHQVKEGQHPTLQYSLNNADLRGYKFEKEMKFENFKVDSFNFKDVVFKDRVSFENSDLTKTSFKNISFEKGVSFKGATIDAKTLESLAPEIRKHNLKHPESQITLDEVKIVGDISKISLKDLSLKGADLTEATTVSKSRIRSYTTDVQNADLTNAKLPTKEGQTFKNQEKSNKIVLDERTEKSLNSVSKMFKKHSTDDPGKVQPKTKVQELTEQRKSRTQSTSINK